MQEKTTTKDTGTDTAPGSLTGVDSIEGIGAVESLGQAYSKNNANAADDAILRAQGHKAAMPRLFSIVSTMGLMFWYILLGLICSITVS
jgi:choline transport protein